MTLSTKIEFLRILHLFAVGLHTCTAVARSLCVSWAFLFRLPLTAPLRSPDFTARSARVPLRSHSIDAKFQTQNQATIIYNTTVKNFDYCKLLP